VTVYIYIYYSIYIAVDPVELCVVMRMSKNVNRKNCSRLTVLGCVRVMQCMCVAVRDVIRQVNVPC